MLKNVLGLFMLTPKRGRLFVLLKFSPERVHLFLGVVFDPRDLGELLAVPAIPYLHLGSNVVRQVQIPVRFAGTYLVAPIPVKVVYPKAGSGSRTKLTNELEVLSAQREHLKSRAMSPHTILNEKVVLTIVFHVAITGPEETRRVGFRLCR